ncbi:proton-conducting transporter transmembrane domain-containing protein [Anaerolinea thermophila]|uniref:Hypothetical membrane protein n=1 Tax=Anaerolinea thermophila (strain DSM 14523 / JCM 11388 / NBRC 100420 / UNI-1) TaxID=926569 RepID=E8MYC0_ANATU|nr:proton-conducting transporter membrane subunit [Anaerolinea thermophila]BAJ62065.1 hypothetical membrane protein [Anaerolinea thermophila UNI-1]
MNAPLIWILFPLFFAFILWLVRWREGWVMRLGVVLCLLLALLAWLLPIGTGFRVFGNRWEIEPTLALAGRQLVVQNNDRPLLIFVYLIAAFWFGGSREARAHRFMIPYGLAVAALLLAALSVQPFLYAALLVELAVLLSIPLVAPPGKPVGTGALRYLIFQTFAMPFILLAGWALSAVEANPANTFFPLLAQIFLGVGFALWLAVFPFYAWMPLVAEEADPYPLGYLLMLLPTTFLLLGVRYINAVAWLKDLSALWEVLRLTGVVMILTAGGWAVFQRHLGRLFAYAVTIETGTSLLALSLNTPQSMETFAMLFLPRVLALALWALSASVMRSGGKGLRFEDLDRAAETFPFASAGLATAYLSLAGLPLLAGFPARFLLLEELATRAPLSAVLALAGTGGLLLSGFRVLAVLTGGYFGPREPRETPFQAILISVGVVVLILLGFLPRLLFPAMLGLVPAILMP